MNSCVLMAEIIKSPELRYTADSQTAIAEMLVEFPGVKAEDPPATLKVVGWGNLAQEIQERYHQGDRVVIEGRLTMNTIERPEGFKEKRAELTVSRIHAISTSGGLAAPADEAGATSNNVVSLRPRTTEVDSFGDMGQGISEKTRTSELPPQPVPSRISTPNPPENTPDLDDIPF